MLLGLAAFLADLGEDCPTWRVYSILQELCAPRVLVDKTPPNSSHPNILHRSYEIFASPSYVHLVRHPYAAIGSGVQLTRDILGNLDSTWGDLEQAWVDANLGVLEFLHDAEPTTRQLRLRCVEHPFLDVSPTHVAALFSV